MNYIHVSYISEANRRELTRWLVLMTAHVCRPLDAPFQTILRVVQEAYKNASEHEIKLAVEYLKKSGHVIHRCEKGFNFVELTRQGIDMVEYTIPAEPGIYRPEVR